MKEFLRSVAEHYFKDIAGLPPSKQDWLTVTDYLFVFPSRRAGLFFSQYLHDIRNEGLSNKSGGGVPLFAPQVITIGELFDAFSDTRLADHTQLLFELYKVYPQAGTESFDNFIFWGEMLLNDFADVDRYMADARQIFYNVRDLKEIEEEMGGPLAGLSDEAKAAICQFWRHVKPDSQGGEVKSSFQHTWSQLFEIYSRFRDALRAQGLAYDGMRQRDVVESLDSEEMRVRLDRLPKHIVFVGITAINEAERRLMRWLRDEHRAEFCWDYADVHLRDTGRLNDNEVQAHASYFTKRNLADFPNAMSDDELTPYLFPEEEREITRVPVPSGVGQVTEAARILKEWGTHDALHTAVVLADENLLVPMCYAVPADFGKFNVTMGYSLRATQAFSFVEALADLQNNYRAQSGTFYYKSVLPLLGHGFLLNLEPETAPVMTRIIQKEGLYQVPVARLQAASPLMKLIFTPAINLVETQQYLASIFDKLLERVAAEAQTDSHPISDLEKESLICYAQQLQQLFDEICRSGVKDLTRLTLFRLLQRLAGSQRVSFSGEPLTGLQVMGILETRALDFDRVVMLSMNEGTFPAKPSQNTFIPAALRSAFGLPTQRHKDSVIAYHFYRLLSRASKVSLLFDSRTSGMKSGEESRYLLQLKYLSKSKMTSREARLSIATEEAEPIVIEKDANVMSKLSEFYAGSGRRNISATSLKQFIHCPLQFYFAHVLHLREEDELEEEVADNQFGDILHHAMEYIYAAGIDKTLRSDNIHQLFESKAIDTALEHAFRDILANVDRTGYYELILKLIKQYIEGILKHDAKLMPMHYLASEGEQVVDYRVDANLHVRLKAVYDRLDIVIDRQTGQRILRVVDYKTGNPSKKLEFGGIPDLFNDKGKGSMESFQVLFYCLMLRYATDEVKRELHLLPETAENTYQIVQPHLYFTRHFVRLDGELKTQLTCNKQQIDDFDVVADEFQQALNTLLRRIFDPSEPFTQCENRHTCEYCAFRDVCGF